MPLNRVHSQSATTHDEKRACARGGAQTAMAEAMGVEASSLSDTEVHRFVHDTALTNMVEAVSSTMVPRAPHWLYHVVWCSVADCLLLLCTCASDDVCA